MAVHPSKRVILTADDVRKMLPQRAPVLLLDKVIELVPGQSAVGVKNVSVNEPYFQGHFPERLIVPGATIIEVSAQLTAILLCAGEGGGTGVRRLGYLAAVRDFKFLKPVVPGDQMIIRVRGLRSEGSMYRVDVEAFVEDDTVAKGVLWVADAGAAETSA